MRRDFPFIVGGYPSVAGFHGHHPVEGLVGNIPVVFYVPDGDKTIDRAIVAARGENRAELRRNRYLLKRDRTALLRGQRHA